MPICSCFILQMQPNEMPDFIRGPMASVIRLWPCSFNFYFFLIFCIHQYSFQLREIHWVSTHSSKKEAERRLPKCASMSIDMEYILSEKQVKLIIYSLYMTNKIKGEIYVICTCRHGGSKSNTWYNMIEKIFTRAIIIFLVNLHNIISKIADI